MGPSNPSSSPWLRALSVGTLVTATAFLCLPYFEKKVWFDDGYSLRGWGLFLSFARWAGAWGALFAWALLWAVMLCRRRLEVWCLLFIVLGLAGLFVAGTRNSPRDQQLAGMLKRADECLKSAEVSEWARPALSNPGQGSVSERQDLRDNMPHCVREFYPVIKPGRPQVYEMAIGPEGRDGRVIVVDWGRRGLMIGESHLLESIRSEVSRADHWNHGIYVFLQP